MYQKVPDVRTRQIKTTFPPISRRLFAELNMAARFVEVSEEDLAKFSKENENQNTMKKTEYDLRIFREYMASINEDREIETLMFSELQNILMKFILAVKKKSGEEYEPSSIRAIIQSIDRYLKRSNYGASILHDREFSGPRYFEKEAERAKIPWKRK